MADPSKRMAAIADLQRRLEYITVANDYHTNAGEHLFWGEAPRLGPNDAPAAIAVLLGDATEQVRGGQVISVVPISIQAIVPAGGDNALLAVEAVLADIKRAVEIEGLEDGTHAGHDRFLGSTSGEPVGTTPKGLARVATRSQARVEGQDYVGGAVDYEATFQEKWGTP